MKYLGLFSWLTHTKEHIITEKQESYFYHTVYSRISCCYILECIKKKMNIKDYRKKKLTFYELGFLSLIPLQFLSIYDKKYDTSVNNKKMLKN